MSDVAQPLHGHLLHVGVREVDTTEGRFRVHVHRSLRSGDSALAIALGDLRTDAPVLARIHSSCVTSESIGARDCDCAAQLRSALARIAVEGRGVVFYLTQEGRGAGLLAKARDRMLVQASNGRMGTFEAFARMGLHADERRYDEVASICHVLGVRAPLCVLSNNPDKLGALEREGVRIAGATPLQDGASPFNVEYLAAKSRSGHVLDPATVDGDAATLPEVVVDFAPGPLPGAPHLVRVASYLVPVEVPDLVAGDGAGRIHWFRLTAYHDLVARRDRLILGLTTRPRAGPLLAIHREAELERLPLRGGGDRRRRWRALLAAVVEHGCGFVAFLPEGSGGRDADLASASLLARHVLDLEAAQGRGGGARVVVLPGDGAEESERAEKLAADLWARSVRLGSVKAVGAGARGCASPATAPETVPASLPVPTSLSDDGLASLAVRCEGLTDALRRELERPLPAFDWTCAGSSGGRPPVVTTGVGSSAAHARFLASLLADHAGVEARFVPTSALLFPPADAARSVLVVFSQGLSPNGRLALGHVAAWRRVVLVTAVADEDLPTELRGGRVDVVRLDAEAENEYDTLLRVTGPMLGFVAAGRVARAVATTSSEDPERASAGLPLPPPEVLAAVASADDAVETAFTAAAGPAWPRLVAGRSLVFLGCGLGGACLDNLPRKFQEGAFLPPPQLVDLIEFAHGPFQQIHDAPATLVAWTGTGSPGEDALLGRVRQMIDPARHLLVELRSSILAPWSVLAHEAMGNALALRLARERSINNKEWPGKRRDAPLYDVGPASATLALRGARVGTRATAARLATLTSPELEAAFDSGMRTAIVPLGATEQHGAHLPLATDTWIADELAARLAARVGDALILPTLPVGCSREHGAFRGTLDLSADTLVSILGDILHGLRVHGFERAFVFSAHGGNVPALNEAAARLTAAVAPLRVAWYLDLDGLTQHLHATAAANGIAPGDAGHHAGEIETSILAGRWPWAVRRAAARRGVIDPRASAQELFHPSLRDRAPDGVVGDPTQADPARAEIYLEAWTDRLERALRAAIAP